MNSVNLLDLPNPELLVATLEAEQQRRQVESRLQYYQPYPVQKRFHDAGAEHRERLLMAANRIGKTQCGAAEMAFHLTGQYAPWWRGKRFEGPIRAWAAGVTGESCRDVVQEKLIGPPLRRLEWGSGMIPKDCLGDISVARGIADSIDTVSVKHVSGGYSQLQFKSYADGRTKWQGVGLHAVWCDEEMPEDLYFEALTRIGENNGIVYCTFTPTAGMTSICRMFLHEGIKI
jgi:phage terminase large subunit-like protein